MVEARTQSPSLIRLNACHMSSDSSGMRVTLLGDNVYIIYHIQYNTIHKYQYNNANQLSSLLPIKEIVLNTTKI